MSDAFATMKKNTVSAYGQLEPCDFITFDNPTGTGPRIMFVGNSMTLHGILPSIGWHNFCGMAASSADKDYVHLLEKKVSALYPDAAFCICQVAEWERRYKEGGEVLPLYKQAQLFDADIILIRYIENCPGGDFDNAVFKAQTAKLMDYLDHTKKAKILVSTGFWRHPGDTALREFAAENGYTLVELGDLGDTDEMKALGLFEHEGVAHHPGDKGMAAMADRLWSILEPAL